MRKLILHPLIWIFILALFLRTYKLSSFPPGFHVDEVKAGWNAYSLWKTGRDDWLHPFPLHYDTFGDQRPTGFFYAAVPSLALFGLTEFAVRFTPALFGSLAVIALYFLALLTANDYRLATFSAFMLAISPWHISLSRASSEGIISTTLILFGLTFLLKKKYLVSSILLILSYFFYHTARLLVPVFIFCILLQSFFSSKKINFQHAGLFSLFIILTFLFIFSPAARGRLSQVSIFNDPGIRVELTRFSFEEGPNRVFTTRMFHNKIIVFTSHFVTEFSRYFSTDFLFNPQVAKPARYQTASKGLLLFCEFFLLVLGLVAIAQKKSPILPLLLLLVSPFSAAITTEDTPNLHRALLMSPFISLIAAAGLIQLRRFNKYIFVCFLGVLSLEFYHYSHLYLIHNPARDEITITRNAGVKDLIQKLSTFHSQFSTVYLTNRPDHLYPWYAFYTRQDPKTFNPQIADHKNTDFTVNGITFSQYRCPSEFLSQNPVLHALAIDAEGCPSYPNLTLVDTITRSSGGHPYTIWTYPRPTLTQ